MFNESLTIWEKQGSARTELWYGKVIKFKGMLVFITFQELIPLLDNKSSLGYHPSWHILTLRNEAGTSLWINSVSELKLTSMVILLISPNQLSKLTFHLREQSWKHLLVTVIFGLIFILLLLWLDIQ